MSRHKTKNKTKRETKKITSLEDKLKKLQGYHRLHYKEAEGLHLLYGKYCGYLRTPYINQENEIAGVCILNNQVCQDCMYDWLECELYKKVGDENNN